MAEGKKVILITGTSNRDTCIANDSLSCTVHLGANAGMGFELSRLVAKKGYKVWMAARNPVAGEEAA